MTGGGALPPLPAALKAMLGHATAEPVLAGEAGATVVRYTAPDGSVRFLKSGKGRVATDIGDEAARLEWLAGRMPCPRVLQFTSEGDIAWLLTTGVAGHTGDAWLARSPDNLPMVIDGFAELLRVLHALPVADCPFDGGATVRLAAARRNLDAGLVDIDDFDDDHAGWTVEQVWEKLTGLIPPDYERVVTHGDFSLGNVLLDEFGTVTGLIDAGRLGVADPYQDIAILWQNLAEYGANAQQRLLAGYGLAELDPVRLAFHRCLDEFF